MQHTYEQLAERFDILAPIASRKMNNLFGETSCNGSSEWLPPPVLNLVLFAEQANTYLHSPLGNQVTLIQDDDTLTCKATVARRPRSLVGRGP